MPKVTVIVDTDLCIAAANCTSVAPNLFQIGDESHAEVLDRSGAPQGPRYSFEATTEELDALKEAVESCPTRAISVERL